LRHAFAQAAFHVHAHDVGCQEVNRLAQHRGFGFNAADSPTDNAQSIDSSWCANRYRPNYRDSKDRVFPDALTKEFQIDLVTDAYARRNDAKAVERLHAHFRN